MDIRVQQLLEKRGIKDINELNAEEKKDLDRWNLILSDGQMTVEKITDFCLSQLSLIKLDMRKLENTPEKNQKLVTQFNIYDTLIQAIQGQKAEREQLERYLQDLLTSG